MAELNDRQRKFAQGLVAGKTQEVAYREAFDCKGKASATVKSNASRLAKNDNLLQYMQELRGKAEAGAIMGRQERMERLSEQARAAAREGDRSGLARMVDLLNKMDGAYEPEKVEVQGEMGVAGIVAALQMAGQRPVVKS